MGHLRNDKIYSGNTRLKKSRKVGQKQTPQEFCGDLFIPGGARNLLPLGYERPAPNTRTKGLKTGKNRELYFSPHSTQNKPKCANITQL